MPQFEYALTVQFMVSLISSNLNTNVPIELSGNMTKETMKTSDVLMFSIGILYPIMLIYMLIIEQRSLQTIPNYLFQIKRLQLIHMNHLGSYEILN